MGKTLERQYLIEAETKLEAVQFRLDSYWPDYPPKFLVMEWNRLQDQVNALKKELGL